jgi:hypothetical protein
VVTLSGQDLYLGKWNTRASRDAYDRLIGEWMANGRSRPQKAENLTVAELVLRYWRFASSYYRKNGQPTGSIPPIRVALRLLRRSYETTLAANLGPLALEALQHKLIDAGKSRSTINEIIAIIRRAFRWAVTELLTRARVAGIIPMNVIADPTRPVTIWDVHADVQGFIRRETTGFCKGYWRNLMQSQPNHIEIVGEKNTVASTIRPVAGRYCIPTTIGRGFCSLRPRYDIAERFRKSGKNRLVLLMLSDFDPDGEEIAHTFARSLRDDFDIVNIEPIKVALTAEQVEEYSLPAMMTAKTDSKNYQRFADKHGDNVWELEAVQPATLQQMLQDAIDNVLVVEAFNHEIDQEKADAAKLEGVRRVMLETLGQWREGGEGDA